MGQGRKWIEGIIEIGGREIPISGYCLTCKAVTRICNPLQKKVNGIVLYSGTCYECGSRIERVASAREQIFAFCLECHRAVSMVHTSKVHTRCSDMYIGYCPDCGAKVGKRIGQKHSHTKRKSQND
jgi:predicted nucleic acid-binding Zn ribbon protein